MQVAAAVWVAVG